jgi:hypothetical protein
MFGNITSRLRDTVTITHAGRICYRIYSIYENSLLLPGYPTVILRGQNVYKKREEKTDKTTKEVRTSKFIKRKKKKTIVMDTGAALFFSDPDLDSTCFQIGI